MGPAKTRELKHFGIGILAGFVALVGGLTAVGVAIARFAPENMPAPAISTLVHMDEKLRFIRERPALDPTILAVGSSVTWRQVAGGAFDAVAGGAGSFLNGGTAQLQVHQTRTMTNFYLSHFPNVRALLVMVSLPDFSDCTIQSEHLVEQKDAARYAFDNWPATYFYFRYVSPQRYLRAAMTLAERRTPMTGDLYLDVHGSGPLQVPDTMKRGLRYGKTPRDPACTAALDSLIADMEARGIQLVLVFAPIHPDYRALYPADITWLDDLAGRVAAAGRLGGKKTIVLDMIRDPSFAGDDFFDAFHLQWNAVKVLSKRIAGALKGAPDLGEKGKIANDAERWASKRRPQENKRPN
jgi:hypothetical protein